jgi:hypothetical protein
MIEVHELTPKTFKVAPSGKIAEDDFLRLAPPMSRG